MSIFSHFQNRFETTRQEEMSLQEYLELCKADPSTYASAAERLLMAIGEPELIDTSLDPRLSRIFSNKVIKRYPAFADFHGMEDAVDRTVSFFKHAAQGLEERARCAGPRACLARGWPGGRWRGARPGRAGAGRGRAPGGAAWPARPRGGGGGEPRQRPPGGRGGRRRAPPRASQHRDPREWS